MLPLLTPPDWQLQKDAPCACGHPLVKSFRSRRIGIAQLLDLLVAEDETDAAQAAWVLRHIAHNSDDTQRSEMAAAAPALVAAASHAHDDVAANAVGCLSNIAQLGDEPCRDALVACKPVLPALVEALRHDCRTVAFYAARALGNLYRGDRGDGPASQPRRAALGAAGAMRALASALDRRDEGVLQNVCESLMELMGSGEEEGDEAFRARHSPAITAAIPKALAALAWSRDDVSLDIVLKLLFWIREDAKHARKLVSAGAVGALLQFAGARLHLPETGGEPAWRAVQLASILSESFDAGCGDLAPHAALLTTLMGASPGKGMLSSYAAACLVLLCRERGSEALAEAIVQVWCAGGSLRCCTNAARCCTRAVPLV